jgi:hypothetical protein
MAALIPSASATGSGTMTLAGPSTNSNQTVTIPDATGTMMVSGNMPAFSAYKNSGNQSITAATFTKITLDTELFDTNNNFASSTFTPTVAGYYQVNAGLSTSGSTAQTRAIFMLYKNGNPIYSLQDLTIVSYRYSGGAVVYMNGSTDYLEIYAYINCTAGIAESGLGSVGYNTWFNGCLMRAA